MSTTDGDDSNTNTTTTDERVLLLHTTDATTTTTECNALRIRIEFLEETIRNYRSLPADLLSTFDVNRCGGNCEVLRQNFWDVWSTNASLHGKFENEMRWYKDAIRSRDDHVMELQSVNALLEKGLNQTNAQLFEMRRGVVERLAEENEDLEAFFTRKLEEERTLSIAMRSRIAELEETLYLKEHESGARQMQINHLLSLSNQLEHAAEVSRMRNKLFDAEKRIQEMDVKLKFTLDHQVPGCCGSSGGNNNNRSLQQTNAIAAAAYVSSPCNDNNNNNHGGGSSSSSRLILPQVNIEQNDKRLASRFKDFFRRLDADGPPSSDNLEEHMYDQFLLDQPNRAENKVRTDMFTRDEILQAMHDAVGGGFGGNTTTTTNNNNAKAAKIIITARGPQQQHHHSGVRICKRDFAACLASMGGKFKRRRGVRFWVNMGMRRKPLFSWDV